MPAGQAGRVDPALQPCLQPDASCLTQVSTPEPDIPTSASLRTPNASQAGPTAQRRTASGYDSRLHAEIVQDCTSANGYQMIRVLCWSQLISLAAQQLLAQSWDIASASRMPTTQAVVSKQPENDAQPSGKPESSTESFRPFKRRILDRSYGAEQRGSDASDGSVSEAYRSHPH